MNSSRLIPVVYLVVLAVLGIVAVGLFFDAYAEYQQLQQTEATLKRTLADADARLKEQKVILERLRNDPAYIEKVIRDKLEYAKPDDVIFRFK